MDQVKVGNYILKKRKELGITQKELAENIGVTDKAISKWERGNALPDVTRLKPLCDALNVSLNELIAGEDICELVLSQKTEENIMSLFKENETCKKNGMIVYAIGIIMALIAVCLLGISLSGSSTQSVFDYLDIFSALFIALFVGIGVMLSEDKSKIGVWTMIQKMSVPAAVFVTLFQMVMVLKNITDVSKLGPHLAATILPLIYGVVLYMVSVVVKSHLIN